MENSGNKPATPGAGAHPGAGIQGPCELPELRYRTWGGYGQHSMTAIGLPVEDRIVVVQATSLAPRRRGEVGEVEVKVEGYTIKAHGENFDSRKNVHRYAKIIDINPVPEFVVIINENASARNIERDYQIIDMKTCEVKDANIISETSEEVKVVENDKISKKIKVEVEKKYVVVGGKKYLIETNKDEYVVEKKTKKLTIYVVERDGEVAKVTGDTYQLRQALKGVGMVWDSWQRAWVPRRGRTITADQIEEAVKASSVPVEVVRK